MTGFCSRHRSRAHREVLKKVEELSAERVRRSTATVRPLHSLSQHWSCESGAALAARFFVHGGQLANGHSPMGGSVKPDVTAVKPATEFAVVELIPPIYPSSIRAP